MKVKFCDKKFFTRGIAYLEQKERKKSFLTTLFSFFILCSTAAAKFDGNTIDFQ